MEHVREVLGVSERRTCQVLGQSRSTQRYRSRKPEGDVALVAVMDERRRRYKRSGYGDVWSRLRRTGRYENRKRVREAPISRPEHSGRATYVIPGGPVGLAGVLRNGARRGSAYLDRIR